MSKPQVNITLRIDEDLYKKFDKAGFNFSRFMQDSLYALIKRKKIYLNLLTGQVVYSIDEISNKGPLKRPDTTPDDILNKVANDNLKSYNIGFEIGYKQGEEGKKETTKRILEKVKLLKIDIKKHFYKVVNPKENILRALRQLEKQISEAQT